MSQPAPRITSGDALARARRDGRPALIAYLPAGYPDVQSTIDAAIAAAKNGADIIEIGLPYSDPVMDGPVIQAATTESLANGFKVPQVFEIIDKVTAEVDAAVLIMTYWNLVMRMGVDEFARRLAEAGGAGLITPDLLPEEASDWMEASEKYGLDRVFLTAPSNTPERVKQTVEASRGFVYCVSIMGVTGARDTVSDAAQGVVEAVRAAGDMPACVGLGVSQRKHVEEIGAYADGVIVGTALVRELGENGPEGVGKLTAALAGRGSNA